MTNGSGRPSLQRPERDPDAPYLKVYLPGLHFPAPACRMGTPGDIGWPSTVGVDRTTHSAPVVPHFTGLSATLGDRRFQTSCASLANRRSFFRAAWAASSRGPR